MSDNRLVDKKYKYGSIKRKYYQGYNNYYQVNFGDIYIDLTTKNRVIVDKWMREKLHNRRGDYLRYIQTIDDYLGDLAHLDNHTDEDIYTDIQGLRRSYFDIEVLIEDTYNQVAVAEKKAMSIQEMTMMILMQEGKGEEGLVTAINEHNKYEQLLQDKNAILIVPNSYKQLGYLSRYMKDIQHQVDRIFILLKEKPDMFMASKQHFECLEDTTIKELVDTEKIVCVTETSTCYGYNYKTLDHTGMEQMKSYIESDSLFILGFGEHSLLGIKNMQIESIVMSGLDIWRAREMTLLVDEVYNYAVVYIPPHFNIYDYVSHNEKSILTYYQLSRISQEQNYDQELCHDICPLYAEYSRFFFNLYSLEDKNEVLKDLSGIDVVTYQDFMNKKNQRLMNHINGESDYANYRKSYYNLDTLEKEVYEATPSMKKNCVTVDSILLDGPVDADVKNQGGLGKVTPIRRIAYNQHLHKKRYVLFNFLFFLTPKVSMLYNDLRQNRPKEQISVSSGHMDYMLHHHLEKRTETFPLYHKASIGFTTDGAFQFMNSQLRGGTIHINGHTFHWEEVDVNTDQDRPVKIYTPYLSVQADCDDYSKYQLEVGHHRMNLVIVNDQIVTMRRGEVILPAIGVVVSLDMTLGEELVIQNHLQEDNQGYYHVTNLSYELKLNQEGNKSYRWIYGGGLSIVKNGINLFSDRQIGESVLREEGWLSPLSMQTQESNIHELSRHPRTAFGMTKKQEFFGIVFSGRTKENAGVNYIEMAKIAEKEFGPIHCMINVDGGASSLLALIENQELFELNYPGASPTSTAGMARPINSMLIMEI